MGVGVEGDREDSAGGRSPLLCQSPALTVSKLRWEGASVS